MARNLISGCLKAVQDGGPIDGFEVAMSNVLDDCLEDDLFYQLPLSVIGEVLDMTEEPIHVEKAMNLLDRAYKIQGPNAVLLLQYIRAGPINYDEALTILSPLRTFGVFEPLYEEVDTEQLNGALSEREKEIEALKEENKLLREENARMKMDYYYLTKGTLAEQKARELKKAEARIQQLKELFQLSQKGQQSKFLQNLNIIDAVKSGNLEAVKILCSTDLTNLEVSDAEYESTPLHWAAGWGFLEITNYLITCGADLHMRNKKGCTPLLCAIYDNQFPIVQLLLEKGADVNDCDNEGFSAIHIAAAGGHLDLLRYLVTKGADLGALTIDGGTALWVAAASGDYGVFEYLLQGCRIPIKKAANRGNTVFHQAAYGGNLQIIKFCFKAGLDINAKTQDGETPLALAKNQIVYEYLAQKGAVL